MRRVHEDEPLKFVFPVEVGEWLIRQPEMKLWAYCLNQGITTAIGSYRTKDLRRNGANDRFWFFRDTRHYVGSCSWICELLGIDRTRLIRHVFKNRHVFRGRPCMLRVRYDD